MASRIMTSKDINDGMSENLNDTRVVPQLNDSRTGQPTASFGTSSTCFSPVPINYSCPDMSCSMYWPHVAAVNCFCPPNAYAQYVCQAPCFNSAYCAFCQRPYTCQSQWMCSPPCMQTCNNQMNWPSYPYPCPCPCPCPNEAEQNGTGTGQEPIPCPDQNGCDNCTIGEICEMTESDIKKKLKTGKKKSRKGSPSRKGNNSSSEDERTCEISDAIATRLPYRGSATDKNRSKVPAKRVARQTGLGTCGAKQCARVVDVSPKKK